MKIPQWRQITFLKADVADNMATICQRQVDIRAWNLKARITAYPLGHILHDNINFILHLL